jgi:hypothetical protein
MWFQLAGRCILGPSAGKWYTKVAMPCLFGEATAYGVNRPMLLCRCIRHKQQQWNKIVLVPGCCSYRYIIYVLTTRAIGRRLDTDTKPRTRTMCPPSGMSSLTKSKSRFFTNLKLWTNCAQLNLCSGATASSKHLSIFLHLSLLGH